MKVRKRSKVHGIPITACLHFLLLLIFSAVHSQGLRVSLTPLNVSDHLSQNTIQCIYQDHFGFMWFGTQDGLNKYDGYQIEVFKHYSNDGNSISANHITAISEDAEGNLWIGTRTGGLNKLDRTKNTFSRFESKATDLNSISSNQVNALFKDSRANLWIGTSQGLNLLRKGSAGFQRISLSDTDKQAIEVRAIYEDRTGRIWIGTATGLKVLYNGRWASFEERRENGRDNAINTIAEDQSGKIWLGTNSGLSMFDFNSGTFSRYAIDPDEHSQGGLNPVFSLATSPGNRIWIGSNTTLQLLDATSKKMIPISDPSGVDSRMPNDGIYALFQDKAETLWIGTTSQGILKLDKNLTVFPAYKASLTNIPSAKNIIRGLAEDNNGNLYLATDAGLEYFNRASSTYTGYVHQNGNRNTLSSNYTTSVVFSKRSGLVWVGTYSNGVDIFNPQKRSFRHITTQTKGPHLTSNSIDVLMEDHHGGIWIGTDGGGVSMYEPGNDKMVSYMHNDRDTRHSPCDNTVLAISQDRRGNIWIGGYSKGVSILNPANQTFSHINTRNSPISSDVISCFYEDSRGNMWIGTLGGGLNEYNPKTRKVRVVAEEAELMRSSINYITEDARGNLWISTNQGIVSFDPVKHLFRSFGKINNLKAMEFNLGAGARLSTGEIVMGSINGFNVIDPSRLNFNHNKPDVVFTGMQLFNKPVTVKSGNSPLKQTLLTSKELFLDYSHSVFTISFAALDYTSPENNQYAYILEGFDHEWNYTGNLHSASYTNLNPGTYVFKVKATNNDGIWSDKQASLVIHIRSPYWMAWWFKMAIILFLCAAAYVFYQYRLNFERKQKAKLLELVKKRTLKIREQASHLSKLNEHLVQNASSLEQLNIELTEQKAQETKARLAAEMAQKQADAANSAKSTFLAAMSHELRTPINGVMGMASLLTETALNDEQKEYTDAILTSGQSLLSVINDILDFSRIESGNIELEEHAFDLRQCLEDVYELFGPKIMESGIDLIYLLGEQVPSSVIADSLRLRQILTNLVGNAVKFTHHGQVLVSIDVADRLENAIRLRFTVTDTGIGIPQEQQKNLFKPFHQLDSSITRRYGGSGLGLVICQRLVKLMGGEMEFSSEFGKGTTFSFEISCKINNQPSGNGSATALLEGKSILLVSGNLMSQQAIQGQLRPFHAVTLVAQSRAEAEDILSRPNAIALVVVDLPWSESQEISRFIRKFKPGLPVIQLGSLKNEQHGGQAFFSRVVSKPVRQANLLKAVREALAIEQVPSERKQAVLSESFASQFPFQILIAEDILMNQKLIIWVLNKLGYQPDLANNGIEVLEMMKTKTYDVILMDLQMPEMDGLEATRIIRKTYGDRPFIVALTANAMAEDRDNCMAAGMNDYITKPINLELLTKSLVNLHGTAHLS